MILQIQKLPLKHSLVLIHKQFGDLSKNYSRYSQKYFNFRTKLDQNSKHPSHKQWFSGSCYNTRITKMSVQCNHLKYHNQKQLLVEVKNYYVCKLSNSNINSTILGRRCLFLVFFSNHLSQLLKNSFPSLISDEGISFTTKENSTMNPPTDFPQPSIVPPKFSMPAVKFSQSD